MMFKRAVLALLAATPLATALDSLEIKGRFFVNPKTGNRFNIVGVGYQPGGQAGYKPEEGYDPLTDADACLRDAALMQVLGINTIRVYNLSPDLNHDECVSIFNDAGMYIIIDVNAPGTGQSLTSYQPWESYYNTYLNRTFGVIEAFKSYPNTLMFFASNELINDVNSAEFGPRYVRAVTRDLKNYMKKHSDRYIPIGYSAADVRDILWDQYNYFTCSIEGEDGDISKADVFALNSYSWCGDSSFEQAGYDDLVGNLTDTAVPVFFSEYGCNEVKPRIFTEVAAIYGDRMLPVFSGGLVYEFTQEEADYGLVDIGDDKSATILKDFNTLAEQLKKLDFDKLTEQAPPSPNDNKPAQCSANLITTSGFDSNFTLPDMPSDNSPDILENGVSPAPVGALATVSDYSVSAKVTDSKKNVVTGLEVKKQDVPNRPGTNDAIDTSADSAAKDSPESSTSTDSQGDKEDGAGLLRPSMMALALGVAAVVALFA